VPDPTRAVTPEPFRLSIRWHLVGFGVAILLPILVVGAYLAKTVATRERARMQENAQVLASDLAAAVDRELGLAVAALQGLATSPSLQSGDLASFDDQARTLLARRGNHVSMRDPSGQQLINTFAARGAVLPVTSRIVREVDEHAFATGRPVVSNLYIGAVSKRPFVLVDLPVIIDGQPRYALNMAIRPEKIAEVLKIKSLPEGWTAAAVDGNGVVIARTREMNKFVGTQAPASYLAYASRAEATWTAANVEGVPALAAMLKSQVSDWRIVVGVPLAVLEAPLRQYLMLLAGFAAIGIAASVALGLLYGRRLARDVLALCVAAEAVGSRDAARPGRSVVRELAQVGAALEEASHALDAREREREQAASRQQLLINELNHRVKNTLATVQSLVSQTARRKTSPDEFREALEARLLSLSQRHNLLTANEWAGAELEEMVRGELGPHDSTRITVDGPRVYLSSQAALALGMVLHELATNAAKHGALGAPEGQLSVSWRVTEDPSPRLILDWVEQHDRDLPPPSGTGFGSRLIRSSVEDELGGTARLLLEARGMRFQAEIPCEGICSLVTPISAGAASSNEAQTA
jgi:two-component sensor histidine kinase